jgi:hypothetical protein
VEQKYELFLSEKKVAGFMRVPPIKSFVVTILGAVAQTAAAEPLPFGCYVTDDERSLYYTPPTCYVIQEAMFSYLTPANTSLLGLVNAYGDVAASFIKLGYETSIGLQQCDAAYNREVSLVKRLRRACGAKCRRVR